MSTPNVILNSKNEPYATEEAARKQIIAKNLDPEMWIVIPARGGYVIMNPTATLEAAEQFKTRVEELDGNFDPNSREADYYIVEWQEKTDKKDPDNVELTLNNRVLLFKRGVRSICPKAFLEVADHAFHHQYEIPKGGRTLKKVAKILKFPYRILGTATEEEFQRAAKEGSAILEAAASAVGAQ